MRGYLDIETTGLLWNGLDYSQLPYKLKPTYRIHCAVIEDVVTGAVFKYRPDEMEEFKKRLLTMTEIIGHNIIDFDMRVLSLYFDIDYEIDLEGVQDTLNGNPCTITDTLVWSKVLNPDRLGGHSLKAWGKKLGILKGDYGEEEEAWDNFSEEMLEYNEQDVVVTKATYLALMKEKGNWDWEDAYKTEKITRYLVSIGEHVGFKFNSDLAHKNLKELNIWLDEIAKEVEPLLPPKKMGKTASKDYLPPVNQLKDDGEINSSMTKFALKVGGTTEKVPAQHTIIMSDKVYTFPLEESVADDLPKSQAKKDGSPTAAMLKWLDKNNATYSKKNAQYTFKYKGNSLKLPMEIEPVETHEPMTLANQTELKQWLVTMGWNPAEWADNDLTVNSKKQKKDFAKFKEGVVRYVTETKDSPFKKFRYEHLGVSTARQMYDKIMDRGLDKPIKVITSPKYTTGQNKDLCHDLERMGESVGFVAQVVKWLTYRHRRNAILSPNGTGFLAHVREDGRISTGADSCGAATSRFKHRVVCNVPRVTSLYGAPIRELFGCDDDCYQIGYDFSGLEARVEGHYTLPYEGGEEYSVALIAEKPNDIHTLTAIANGIVRDEAKTLKYSISYGAQPPKVASQMNWSLQKAQDVFEGFWETALPLKQLKEKVTLYWKKTGKKFIKGIDGRKLYIRSQHSILNMLFQSAGVIAAKKANIFHNIEMKKRGILFNPFKDSSWVGKAAVMIMYHDEAQIQVHKSLVKEFVFDTEEEATTFSIEGRLLADVHQNSEGKWVTHFSPVGELASQSCQKAAEYYNMRVKLAADYIVGSSWKACH